MFAPENKQILVFEEDEPTLRLIQETLTGLGYPVTPCLNEGAALSLAGARVFDLAVAALRRKGTDPLAFVLALKRRFTSFPVVVLARPEELAAAVVALRHGVDDYLSLPPDPNEFRLRLGRILQAHDLDTTMAMLQDEIVKKSSTRDMVVRSEAMRRLVDKAHKLAPMKSTVLIRGESGVGKELIARAIHYVSPRKDRPFVALNCSAIPETLIESELFGHERGAFTGAVARTQGKFELAHRGTLFLDEIGEMNPSVQVKLLRVLEEHEFMRVGGSRSIRVDVRLLAATNADLERLVAEGRFRRDLYFRLKVVMLLVPPLRDRIEDIPHLVRKFVEQICRANNLPQRRVTDEVLSLFQAYQWPGNVRELKNLLESLLVSTTGEVLEPDDLPPSLKGKTGTPLPPFAPRVGMTMDEVERDLIRHTLERHGGNRTHTARALRIGVRTLQRKIALYGLR
jgi:DNA-binding NtrC family response regulator